MTTSLSLRDLIPGTVEAYGAMDTVVKGDGLRLSRLPAWTRPQVPAEMNLAVRTPVCTVQQVSNCSPTFSPTFLFVTLTHCKAYPTHLQTMFLIHRPTYTTI